MFTASTLWKKKRTIFHTRTCFNFGGVVWLFYDNCLNGKNVLFFRKRFCSCLKTCYCNVLIIRACRLVFNKVENVTVRSHFGVKRICTSNLYQSAGKLVPSLAEILIFVCLRSPWTAVKPIFSAILSSVTQSRRHGRGFGNIESRKSHLRHVCILLRKVQLLPVVSCDVCDRITLD